MLWSPDVFAFPGVLPDLSLETLSSSYFAEPGESFGNEILMDALNQFIDDGEKTEENPLAIAKFSSRKSSLSFEFFVLSVVLLHVHVAR